MRLTPKWESLPRAALDFEATGTDPNNDRIVTAAWIQWTDGVRPDTVNRWLVDPGIEIPAEAAEVHGITTERARTEATHTVEQMLFEVTGLVALTLGRGIPVAIYNAPYDLGLLEAENRRNGIDTLADRLGRGKVSPIVDPLVLAKHAVPKRMVTVKDEHGNPVYPEGSKATLKECRGCSCGATDWSQTSTCLHYGVSLRGAHDAVADAKATGRLFPKVMAAHPKKFTGLTVGALHQAQVDWAKEQADYLRGIFNWLGVADHEECPNPTSHRCVDPSWPMPAAALVGSA